MSPHVQGASRWTAVNARQRQAFAISGKDHGSPLLTWLAAGRPEGDQTGAFLKAAAQLGVDDTLSNPGFVGWYQELNANYPFLDYSEPGAQTTDARLMAEYAAEAGAPSYQTAWQGASMPLPTGRLGGTDGADPVTVELLAAWLQIAAGYTRTRPIRNLRVAHRTSPSGGARHPTELLLQVGPAWQRAIGSTNQMYWYDGAEHSLRLSDAVPESMELRANEVVVTIASHVQRPMWRYRDVRALRPVVIDAGHVIETLIAAVRASGWHAAWSAEPGTAVISDELDPTFGRIAINSSPHFPRVTAAAADFFAPYATEAGPYRTNPLLSLFATDEGIFAEVPTRERALKLTPAMVDLLAYATPSSRADRPTARPDLQERFEITGAELESLCEDFLLLDVGAGDRLWSLSRPWSKYGWLPSLIAHLTGMRVESGSVRTVWQTGALTSYPQLPAALENRRTSRNFTGSQLDDQHVLRVMTAVESATSTVRVAALRHHSSDLLSRGIHLRDEHGWLLLDAEPPSPEAVVTTAIGQSWATGFDLVLLIFPNDQAGTWQEGLIEAGRLAQRVALSVSADKTVGVFQSPALVDNLLDDLVPGMMHLQGAYLIGVGVVPDGGDSVHPSGHFSPSSLFQSK